MIILGVVLAILGGWIFPDYLPDIPAALDSLCFAIGVVLIVVGVILWVVDSITRPRSGGPRRPRYW